MVCKCYQILKVMKLTTRYDEADEVKTIKMTKMPSNWKTPETRGRVMLRARRFWPQFRSTAL